MGGGSWSRTQGMCLLRFILYTLIYTGCLSYFSTSVIKCHDHSNLHKEGLLWARVHDGRVKARGQKQEPEGVCPELKSGSRERTREIFQSPPPVIHFL